MADMDNNNSKRDTSVKVEHDHKLKHIERCRPQTQKVTSVGLQLARSASAAQIVTSNGATLQPGGKVTVAANNAPGLGVSNADLKA